MTVTIDKDHVYHVGDKTPPAVSSILNLYFPPSNFYTEEGRDKGTARHAWYHALVQGLEMENEPDERIAKEVEQFRRFLAEVKPEYVSGEVPYYCPELDYCGTPDLVCKISGRLAVVDFKPATAHPRWKLQTAAYYTLLHSNGTHVLDRYILRVLPDCYRLEKHTNAQDIPTWRILAAAFQARRAYE